MDEVAEVRRFTRLVTQRVGALHDHYLARDRPLGEARLLWEINTGADVRDLRTRLDLDSGYVSRLLRSLGTAGLVTVETSEQDKRRRVARLTDKGQAERAILDERAEDVAAGLLSPLNSGQRTRLVAAMREVDRLLTAGLVTIAPTDPDHPHARHCLTRYFQELDQRFGTGFDVAKSIPADGSLLLVATLHGEPVGCGALQLTDDRHAYVKRMWVAEKVRGLGIGRRLLSELEDHARARHRTTARLETNRALEEAIRMYRAAGYREVAPFNEEYYAHHWFEKAL